MPFSKDVEYIAYHPLDHRPGFKFAMQRRDGRFYLYVAHLWEASVSILDVTDPRRPELKNRIEGPGNT